MLQGDAVLAVVAGCGDISTKTRALSSEIKTVLSTAQGAGMNNKYVPSLQALDAAIDAVVAGSLAAIEQEQLVSDDLNK